MDDDFLIDDDGESEHEQQLRISNAIKSTYASHKEEHNAMHAETDSIISSSSVTNLIKQADETLTKPVTTLPLEFGKSDIILERPKSQRQERRRPHSRRNASGSRERTGVLIDDRVYVSYSDSDSALNAEPQGDIPPEKDDISTSIDFELTSAEKDRVLTTMFVALRGIARVLYETKGVTHVPSSMQSVTQLKSANVDNLISETHSLSQVAKNILLYGSPVGCEKLDSVSRTITALFRTKVLEALDEYAYDLGTLRRGMYKSICEHCDSVVMCNIRESEVLHHVDSTE